MQQVSAAARNLNPVRADTGKADLMAEYGEAPALSLPELERWAIVSSIRRNGGNLSKCARQLGIGRTTLYRKIKEYDIR